jgi:hypothetical protein
MDQHVIRLMNFLLKILFTFQGIEAKEVESRIFRIEKSIACELTTICDGLYHEFGYEINEKDHFFKL